VRGVVTTPAYAGRRTARQDDEGGGRWTLQGWSVSASAQRRLPRPADRPHHRISDLPRLCRVILCAARRSHRLLPLSGDHPKRLRAKDRRAVLLQAPGNDPADARREQRPAGSNAHPGRATPMQSETISWENSNATPTAPSIAARSPRCASAECAHRRAEGFAAPDAREPEHGS